MKTYQPGLVKDPELARELTAITQAAQREEGYLGVLPSNPQDRIYLFAAGVAGTGRGAYRYDSSTASWVFLA